MKVILSNKISNKKKNNIKNKKMLQIIKKNKLFKKKNN